MFTRGDVSCYLAVVDTSQATSAAEDVAGVVGVAVNVVSGHALLPRKSMARCCLTVRVSLWLLR